MDQAHLSRMFKAAFGIAPAHFRALQVRGASEVAGPPGRGEGAWTGR